MPKYDYPLHPGQTHAEPLYAQIPLEEYERLMQENKRLKVRTEELERKDTEHTVQIAKMNVYIHHLEEERRWRKFPDEMPQKYDDGDCFLIAVEHESTTSPKGYYETIAELVDGSWSDDEGRDIDEYIEYEYDLDNSLFHSQAPKGKKKGFYRNKVTHWMPLPPAPKEDK